MRFFSNKYGNSNTATGVDALSANINGYGNEADGCEALPISKDSVYTTAIGYEALYDDNGGIYNTACGAFALSGNTTGQDNIGIGYYGGFEVTTGYNNIEIGSSGTGSDNGVTRIGVEGVETSAYVAGIYGESADPNAAYSSVYVDSDGKLFTSFPTSTASIHAPAHDATARLDHSNQELKATVAEQAKKLASLEKSLADHAKRSASQERQIDSSPPA